MMFNTSETDMLINLVRENQAIYNSSLNEHSQRDTMDEIWDSIAEKMDRKVSECKDKWANLRTVFRRKIREHHYANSEDGAPHKRVKKWYWMKSMMFLYPHLKEIEPIISLPMENDELICSPDLSEHEDTKDGIASPALSDDLSNSCTQKVQFPSISQSKRPRKQLESYFNANTEIQKFPKTENGCGISESFSIANTEIQKFPKTENVRRIRRCCDLNADEMFFKSLLPDFRSLSAKDQGTFKLRVQELLQTMLYPDDITANQIIYKSEPFI